MSFKYVLVSYLAQQPCNTTYLRALEQNEIQKLYQNQRDPKISIFGVISFVITILFFISLVSLVMDSFF